MSKTIGTRDTTVLAARRAQLEAERDHLLDLAGVSVDELVDVDPEDPTRGRDAVSANLSALTRSTLAEVTAALARLDAGTYGRCEGCGASVPDERLEIMPAARFCVACQQRSE